MNKLFPVLFLFAFVPSVFAQDELALYSIDIAIEGMTIEDMPPGATDRSLRYEMKIDATDLNAANEVWYGHLGALFGDDDRQEMLELARKWSVRR